MSNAVNPNAEPCTYECEAYPECGCGQAASPAAARVPDGWVLVPAEPTQAMLDAPDMSLSGRAGVYRAMLAAAPKQAAAARVPQAAAQKHANDLLKEVIEAAEAMEAAASGVGIDFYSYAKDLRTVIAKIAASSQEATPPAAARVPAGEPVQAERERCVAAIRSVQAAYDAKLGPGPSVEASVCSDCIGAIQATPPAAARVPLDLTKGQIEHAMRNLANGFFGGFASKLAEAWFVADSGNRKKIEDSWPDLIKRAHSW